ncbi:protein of unknown function [Nitrospira japonica]|uniref:Uncharacterized protein n=1 Tax=Nitrospira japonica TaxID=1325564 RepID=A0A1W1I2K9_9BACT|nr:protein of unknown function [Nitrospira japonica]
MTPLSLWRIGREHDHHPLILAILVLTTLEFSTTQEDVATASDCLTAEFTGSWPTLAFPARSSLRLWNLPPIVSLQDALKYFPTAPACGLPPTLSAGLSTRAGIRDQAIVTPDAAVGQGSRTTITANSAATTGRRTMKTTSRIPTVKIGIPPLSGKTHTFRTWTTPIELEPQTGERPSGFIGPNNQTRPNQHTAPNVFPPAPLVQSERRPVDLSIPLRHVLPQADYDAESNRMNSATALALHGGECAYACP